MNLQAKFHVNTLPRFTEKKTNPKRGRALPAIILVSASSNEQDGNLLLPGKGKEYLCATCGYDLFAFDHYSYARFREECERAEPLAMQLKGTIN